MAKLSDFKKVDKLRSTLVDKALEYDTVLASKINSLCIDLLVEIRIADRAVTNLKPATTVDLTGE